MLLIVLLHALYGCTFTISKVLISFASPMLTIGIRMTLAGFLLSAYALFVSKKQETLFTNSKTISYILQIAIFGTFFPYVLRYWALQFLPVAKTALIYNIAPFISFFFSYFIFDEKATIRKWIGLFFGFAGVIPVLIVKSGAAEAATSGIGFLSWPEIAMLIAVTSFSYGWIVMKKLVTSTSLSPIQINGANMFLAGVMALMTSWYFENTFVVNQPLQFSCWLMLIIIITNFICANMYAMLLRHYSATLLSLAGLIAPISATITSWLYLGEAITIDVAITTVLVILGFTIFYSEELKIKRLNRKRLNREEEAEANFIE